VAFFVENHGFLKGWRNDVGGHFHDTAAAFAIDNIEADAVGSIALYRSGEGANVRMKFAYELVAVAMVKHRHGEEQTFEEFLKDAFTFLVDAVGHSVNAVHILTLTELFDNFR
jgi:hypothetical protein